MTKAMEKAFDWAYGFRRLESMVEQNFFDRSS